MRVSPLPFEDADENRTDIYNSRCKKYVTIPSDSKGLKWTHSKSRQSHRLLPRRKHVPDNQVFWSIQWPEYNDEVPFSEVGGASRQNQIESASHETLELDEQYERWYVRGSKVQKNPYGRTGLKGRGVLNVAGPNDAVDPVITRVDPSSGKTQVLVCRFEGRKDWDEECFCLPGGRLQKVENITEQGSDYLGLPVDKHIPQYLDHVIDTNVTERNRSKETAEKIKETLRSLFQNCGKRNPIYPDNTRYKIGYCDDPRNTDDAWIESQVWHFHIGDGLRENTPLLDIDSRNEYWSPRGHASAAGPTESYRMKFRWLNVDNGSAAYKSLYASHKFFVDLCVPLCACGRRRFDKSDTSHRCLHYTPGPLEEARQLLRREACRAPPSVDSAMDAPALHRGTSDRLVLHDIQVHASKSAIGAWTHRKARLPEAYRPRARFPVDETRVPWAVAWPDYDAQVRPGSPFDTELDRPAAGGAAPPGGAGVEYGGGNPFGRTGLRGRGRFFFWGPNEARDPVITRVPRGSRRTEVLLCKMKQHEVTALNDVLRLPGAMAAGEFDTHAQRRRLPDFLRGVLRHNHAHSPARGAAPDALEAAERELEALFAPRGDAQAVYPDGVLYLHGYVDDPRNTDDAWVTTRVFHFHVPPALGDLLDLDPRPPAGAPLPQELREWRPDGSEGPALHFEWRAVEEAMGDTAYASHGFFIDLCVPLCKCGLRRYDAVNGCHELADDDPRRGGARGEGAEQLELERVPAQLAPRGRMRFGEKPLVSRYVRARVDVDTDAMAVCCSLFEGPRPEIGYWLGDEAGGADAVENGRPFWRPVSIISVTGGAQDFQLAGGDARREREITEQIFPRGILKAAHDMRALVIDGGTASGVMQEVGRAVYKDGDRVATLGICPWGTALDLQHLQLQRKGHERGHYTYTLTSDHPNSDWCAQLDPNHRYFALVDDGRYGREAFGKEVHGRQLIERVLAHGETYTAPHVAVVVNGGLGTIATLRYSGASLSQRGAPPTVVVQGTGRAADLLAAVWHHLHRGDDDSGMRRCFPHCSAAACVDIVPSSNNDNTVGCRHLRQLFKKHMPRESKAPNNMQVLCDVVEICRRKEAVTVHSIDGVDSLAYSVMKSVCVGTMRVQPESGAQQPRRLLPLQLKEQLTYVMEWDGEDAVRVAREMITDRVATSNTFAVSELKSLLSTAILRDRTGFVEVLINSGVHLDFKDVMDLYRVRDKETKNPLHLHVSRLLAQNFKARKRNSERRDQNTSKNRYLDDEMVKLQEARPVSVDKAMSDVMGWSRCGDFNEAVWKSQKLEKVAEETFSTSEEVFLWCILNGRAEMAELYFRKCHPISRQHSIARALFAASISRRVGESFRYKFRSEAQRLFIANQGDKQVVKMDISSRFETIALELLDLCYKHNPESAVDALTMPLLQPWLESAVWVDAGSFLFPPKLLDPVMLTQIANATEFAAHEAFQTALDRIWYGQLVRDVAAKSPRGPVFRLPNKQSRLFDSKVIQVLNSVILPGVDFIEMAYIVVSWVCFPLLIFLHSSDSETSEKSFVVSCLNSCFSLEEWMLRFSAFYTAPITKFWSSFSSYFLFLSLYTVVGLDMGFQETPLELLVNCWILALALAVVRRLLVDGWKTWINKTNNVLDMVTLACYVPAFALRRHELAQFGSSPLVWSLDPAGFGRPAGNASANLTSAPNATMEPLSTTFWALNVTLAAGQAASYQSLGQDMATARSWHGVVGILFWMRCVDFLSVSDVLGPLRLVLFRVLVDAFQFFIFLLIFIVSFGAAMVCAARPVRDPSVPLLQSIKLAVYFPYMQIFGEHFMDNWLFSANPGDSADTSRRQLGTILYCTYLFISAIVLMNLLIAKMNSTYAEEFEGIKKKWLFHRLELVLEYAAAPPLPPPAAAALDLCAVLWSLLAALGAPRRPSAHRPTAAATERAWALFDPLSRHGGGGGAGGGGGVALAEDFFLSDAWMAVARPPASYGGGGDAAHGKAAVAEAAARTRRCARGVSEAFVSWMAAGSQARR